MDGDRQWVIETLAIAHCYVKSGRQSMDNVRYPLLIIKKRVINCSLPISNGSFPVDDEQLAIVDNQSSAVNE
ncbi:hypothetical protein LJR098_006226 [Rhizobium sp. LjRoot98]|uniref:hypothetical protein n=1 Tax=Rhizobium sp. LjRoot98 TaxID=3342345 RepID=UPI003ED01EEB